MVSFNHRSTAKLSLFCSAPFPHSGGQQNYATGCHTTANSGDDPQISPQYGNTPRVNE